MPDRQSGTSPSRHNGGRLSDPLPRHRCERDAYPMEVSRNRNDQFDEIDLDLGKFYVGSRFTIKQLLGAGSTGVVALAIDNEKLERVAIKKEPLRRCKRRCTKAYREISCLRTFKHPNVIALKGALATKQVEDMEAVYLVLEAMDTDLAAYLKDTPTPTPSEVRRIAYQILVGLKYIHSANIIHKHLKPSNILLNSDLTVKLSDFGFLDPVRPAAVSFSRAHYRAPEVLLIGDYSKASDMWAVGCVLGEMLQGSPMFADTTAKAGIPNIVDVIGRPSMAEMSFVASAPERRRILSLPDVDKPNWPTWFPEAEPTALELVAHLLKFNPRDRPAARHILASSYFNSCRDKDTETVCHHVFTFDKEPAEDVPFETVRDLLFRLIDLFV